jgi:hypothetical protein
MAGALLLGLALTACDRHRATTGPTPPPGSIPTAASTNPASPDPIASALDQLDQLIRDIDNAVQSSGPDAQGGE